jgi:hypothetical protein
MSINSETRVFDQILSTTYDAYRPVLVDNIFKMSALYYKLYEGGQVEHQDGGASLVFPLMYGKNETVGWYEDDESIDVTVQEGISVAKMPWTQLAGSISFTRKQRRMNSGRSQIINLITSKIKQAEMSLYETFNSAMFGTGKYNESQTTKELCGLQAIVAASPDTYDVGGIDTSAYTWWRNKVRGNAGTAYTWVDDLDAPATATGPEAMRDLYAWCSKGTGGPPNFGFASLRGYLDYESYMASKQIYRDPDMAKMGFDNIRFRNLSLFWDEDVVSANITTANGQTTYPIFYFLNTNFLHLKVDSQTDFIRTDFKRPVNQDSEAALILWMGNLCTSKRSKHGLLEDNNTTNVT